VIDIASAELIFVRQVVVRRDEVSIEVGEIRSHHRQNADRHRNQAGAGGSVANRSDGIVGRADVDGSLGSGQLNGRGSRILLENGQVVLIDGRDSGQS